METFAQEKIHYNPQNQTLRNLVMNSSDKIVRFAIDHDGNLYAGDAFKFTHLNMLTRENTMVRGNLFFRDNKLFYQFKGVLATKDDIAVIERRLYQAGFEANLSMFRN